MSQRPPSGRQYRRPGTQPPPRQPAKPIATPRGGKPLSSNPRIPAAVVKARASAGRKAPAKQMPLLPMFAGVGAVALVLVILIAAAASRNEVSEARLASGEIGPEGGTITVPNTSEVLPGASLTIPAGALIRSVEISLGSSDRSITPTQAGAGIVLEPDGTKFQIPVTLSLPYKDANGDGLVDELSVPPEFLSLWLHNESLGGWVPIETRVDPSTRTVHATLEHFSEYRLLYNRFEKNKVVTYKFTSLPTITDNSGDPKTAVTNALSTWENLTRKVGIRFMPVTTGEADIEFLSGPIGGSDGELPLAHMCPIKSCGGTDKTVVIRFNSAYQYTLNSTPIPQTYDLETLALHEIGHALGLPHLGSEGCEAPPIMCEKQHSDTAFLILTQHIPHRTLAKEDREAFLALYQLKDTDDPILPKPQPGGRWVSPTEGEEIRSSIRFTATADFKNPGDPAIAKVNFTVRSPIDGNWFVACSLDSAFGNIYQCDFPIDNLPSGPITISFDVYDTAGNFTFAPNGLRTIRKTAGGTGSDADSDGIPDADDKCPGQAETRNGLEDTDGCPDSLPSSDRDGDGIPNTSDSCPDQAETKNGFQDADGCPDSSIPPSATPTPSTSVSPTVTISTDKPSYQLGETITICYSLSRAGNVIITDQPPTGSQTTVKAGFQNAGNYCIPGTIGPPAGTDTLTITLSEGSTLLASKSITYQITSAPQACVSNSGFFDLTPKQVRIGDMITIEGDGTQVNGGWRQGLVVTFFVRQVDIPDVRLGTGTVQCVNGKPSLRVQFKLPDQFYAGSADLGAIHDGKTTCCMPFTIAASNPPPSTNSCTNAPIGGVWVQPAANITVAATSDVLFTDVRAYPSAGAPAVSRVEFTAWWPALGPESGPWRVVSTVPTNSIDGDHYYGTIDLKALPLGDIKLTFNVFNTTGQQKCAPNGARIISRVAVN